VRGSFTGSMQLFDHNVSSRPAVVSRIQNLFTIGRDGPDIFWVRHRGHTPGPVCPCTPGGRVANPPTTIALQDRDPAAYGPAQSVRG
jgi:hypothetical protein